VVCINVKQQNEEFTITLYGYLTAVSELSGGFFTLVYINSHSVELGTVIFPVELIINTSIFQCLKFCLFYQQMFYFSFNNIKKN